MRSVRLGTTMHIAVDASYVVASDFTPFLYFLWFLYFVDAVGCLILIWLVHRRLTSTAARSILWGFGLALVLTPVPVLNEYRITGPVLFEILVSVLDGDSANAVRAFQVLSVAAPVFTLVVALVLLAFRQDKPTSPVTRQAMTCRCVDLPDLFRLHDYGGFDARTDRVEAGDWVYLHKCPECDQRWRINAWDKYQVQFVVRIPDSTDWQAFDATSLEKDFLLRSRGGLTQDECAWRHCGGKRVRGVVYCVDHLYDTGARE